MEFFLEICLALTGVLFLNWEVFKYTNSFIQIKEQAK